MDGYHNGVNNRHGGIDCSVDANGVMQQYNQITKAITNSIYVYKCNGHGDGRITQRNTQ